MTFGPDPDPPAIFASPLVRDSLSALVGGLPAMGVATRPPKGHERTLGNGGAYYRAAGKAHGDSIQFLDAPEDPSTQRRLLTHEFGHALDYRGKHRDLVEAVQSAKPNAGTYASSSPREHFAEAFATGFDAMSQPVRNAEGFERLIQALERITPGTRPVVEWMRQQPLYRNHAMAK